jgi:signal peptidase I
MAATWFFTLRPVAWGGPAGYSIVAGVSMQPTLQPGDLVLTSAQADYAIGDLIAYHVPQGAAAAGSVVVHRIIGGDPVSGFVVKGDNNGTPDPWYPKARDVVGRMWASVPGVGRVLLSFRTPLVLAMTVGAVAGLWWYFSSGSPGSRDRHQIRRRWRWPNRRGHLSAADG